ncbi:hypothetical protein U9M48_025397 [Paspalum notatum var. saurae]|uniref:Uncharacterized protein n=1 Tax=Paspalum notatum var. saurae TaxID=547442 RepID=A0AAQ3TQM8_PASNO
MLRASESSAAKESVLQKKAQAQADVSEATAEMFQLRKAGQKVVREILPTGPKSSSLAGRFLAVSDQMLWAIGDALTLGAATAISHYIDVDIDAIVEGFPANVSDEEIDAIEREIWPRGDTVAAKYDPRLFLGAMRVNRVVLVSFVLNFGGKLRALCFEFGQSVVYVN